MIGLIDTDTILHWNLRERVQAETGLHAYIRTRAQTRTWIHMRMRIRTRIHKRDQVRETRYNRTMVQVTSRHVTAHSRSDRIRIDQDRKVITVIIQYNTIRFDSVSSDLRRPERQGNTCTHPEHSG